MTTLSPANNTPTPLPINIGQPYNRAVASNTSRAATAYYQGFVLSLVLIWSPINLLAYTAPFLMLGWFIFRTRSKTVIKNLIILTLVWLIIILLHLPFVGTFAWAGALMTAITYSAFVPIIVIPTRFLMNSQLFHRMLRWIVAVVILEASWGLVQVIFAFRQSGTFDYSNGDHVEGTIHPGLASEGSFSNPMFAVNMAILLLALLPILLTRRKYVLAVTLGLLSLVLASVIHVLLFLAAAAAISAMLYAGVFLRRVSSWLLIIMAIIGTLLVLYFLSGNLRTLPNFVSETIEARTPRGIVLERVVTVMPEEYPLMPFLGLGPGQFSSRAALIVTGKYFGGLQNPVKVPFIPIQISEPMADYFWNEFVYARSLSYYGSTIQPAFSWLSFYTEMGGIACVILVLFIIVILWRIRIRASSYALKVQAMSLSIGLLFIVFLGIQENYWEVPQAIFPGLLILKAMYAQFRLLASDRTFNPRPATGNRI